MVKLKLLASSSGAAQLDLLNVAMNTDWFLTEMEKNTNNSSFCSTNTIQVISPECSPKGKLK